MHRFSHRAAALTLLLALAPPAGRTYASMAAIELKVDRQSIEWSPRVENHGAVLTISGPEAEMRREYEAGEPIVFELEEKAELADGAYQWELRLVPPIDPRIRERLKEIRERGDDWPPEALRRQGVRPREAVVRSGSFGVRGGAIVPPNEREPGEEHAARRSGLRVSGDLTASGDLTVEGAKRFSVPDPAGEGSIVFAALEGPEVGTYYRGTATTASGEAVIELPAYFARVTEAAGLTVQLTPLDGWSRLYVAGKSVERLVVRDAAGGEAAFDFLIQGVRKGYGGFQPEREADAALGGDR